MKSKVFSVLLVLSLCFTLSIITSYSSAQPINNDKDPLKGLSDKIDEIISVIQMNLAWTPESEIQHRLTGFFQKYMNSSPQKFKFKEAAEGAPGVELKDPAAMAAHLFNNRHNNIDFERKKIEYETVEETTGNEHKIDAKALVYIKFSWTRSPDQIGEITFELFHMKKCIWD